MKKIKNTAVISTINRVDRSNKDLALIIWASKDHQCPFRTQKSQFSAKMTVFIPKTNPCFDMERIIKNWPLTGGR